MPQTKIAIRQDVPLDKYTTIGLGGRAKYFATCRSVADLRDGLTYARETGLPVQVLGGGSNILFADHGFEGLVLKIDLRGLHLDAPGDGINVTVGAGEPWDPFVQTCITRGLAGLECLSGIPGSVGATPIQNVGAYGQEVSDTVFSLQALDRTSLEQVRFQGTDCAFRYRYSRFKDQDRERYVITQVTYRLQPQGRPEIRYPELARQIQSQVDLKTLPPGRPALEAVRKVVLALRRRKSMLFDPNDPDARSVGSFFLNPILTPDQLRRLQARWAAGGESSPIPAFEAAKGIKVPAAWLVEQAGFHKGYCHKGAGISSKHALALVNRGGTTRQLMALANAIQGAVHDRFGIHLEIEPVLVD